MAHALGEMYYLATQSSQRRKHIEQKEQDSQTISTGLVFISPRAPKEYTTILPSDTSHPVETTATNTSSDWCMIM